jgi:rhodanese-related sulfurtransferase
MKIQLHILPGSVLFRLLGCFLIINGLTACKEKPQVAVIEPQIENTRDASLLLEHFAKNGNPVNQAEASALQASDLVYSFTDNRVILDLRSHTEYLRLHIPGSINLPFDRLYFFLLQRNKAFQYREVVLVCADGQQSAYAAALLRMAGVTHARYLDGGIRSWNTAFQPSLTEEPLIPVVNGADQPAGTHALPELQTIGVLRGEIVANRIRAQFLEGIAKWSADTRFILDKKNEGVCIFYGKPEDFRTGHPDGAILVDQTVGINSPYALRKLPANKPLILYSVLPGHAAYLTACLRNLGYDAKYLEGGIQHLKGIDKRPVNYVNNYPLAGFQAEQNPGSIPQTRNSHSPAVTESASGSKKIILKPVNNPAPEGC